LIRTLSAFKTVATPPLEVESHVLPTRLRHKKWAQEVVTRLCTLPRNHPIYTTLQRAKRRSENVKASPVFPLAETIKTMNLRLLTDIEVIEPKPLAPGPHYRFKRSKSIQTETKPSPMPRLLLQPPVCHLFRRVGIPRSAWSGSSYPGRQRESPRLYTDWDWPEVTLVHPCRRTHRGIFSNGKTMPRVHRIRERSSAIASQRLKPF
jgi:hypothetical protein